MEKSEVLKRIAAVGLVPVIRAESKEDALRVVEAIGAGGLTILEITMTVPGAISVIEAIRKRDPNIVVGAGTVLDAETARACILGGRPFCGEPGGGPGHHRSLSSLLDRGHAGSAHSHRSGERMDQRRRRREGLPLRSAGRRLLYQGAQSALSPDRPDAHRRRVA